MNLTQSIPNELKWNFIEGIVISLLFNQKSE
jgi:hypothetical protein